VNAGDVLLELGISRRRICPEDPKEATEVISVDFQYVSTSPPTSKVTPSNS
jgi:hypothetical protein